MEKTALVVRGERADTVPRAIDGYAEDKRVDYDGDGFYVVTGEKYYLRTNSTLQATVVFELVDETTCEVTIVSGGGGSGLLQSTMGSEWTEATRLVQSIEDYCAAHDLDVERM